MAVLATTDDSKNSMGILELIWIIIAIPIIARMILYDSLT